MRKEKIIKERKVKKKNLKFIKKIIKKCFNVFLVMISDQSSQQKPTYQAAKQIQDKRKKNYFFFKRQIVTKNKLNPISFNLFLGLVS